MNKFSRMLCGVVGVLVLVGCGGGGARTTNEISTTTRGQELLDLKKAYEAGALSQPEYDKQRRMVLERD